MGLFQLDFLHKHQLRVSGVHIGDKCKEQMRTFDEVFNGSASDPDFVKPTWAAVVSSGKGVSELQEQKTKEMEVRLKELNKRRRAESQEKQQVVRVQEAEKTASDRAQGAENALIGGETTSQTVTDSQILTICEKEFDVGNGHPVKQNIAATTVAVVEPVKGMEVENREVHCDVVTETINDIVKEISEKGSSNAAKQSESDISIIFGPGATALKQQLLNNKDMSDSASDSSLNKSKTETSAPVRFPSRGRTRTRNSGRSSQSSPSPIRRQDPPDKRVRVDGGQEIDQGQGDDILDPGDQNIEHQLSDSGDWDWGDEPSDNIKGLVDEGKGKSDPVVSSEAGASVTPGS